MKEKQLEWKIKNKSFYIEYRSDISIKGIFGIRFIVLKEKRMKSQFTEPYVYETKYNYKCIINGKHINLGECDNIDDGKNRCQSYYSDICKNIINNLYE